MAELFFEIRSGEIPARMQKQALVDLKHVLKQQLEGLHLPTDQITTYISPRRLIGVIGGLPIQQADRKEERKGPRMDAPAQAIDGFLKTTGKTRQQLEVRDTPKGQFYFDVSVVAGQQVSELIPGLIHRVIQQMPWPKNMRWGVSAQTWVRPITGGCCVFEGKGVPFQLKLDRGEVSESLQVSFDDTTPGHRFLAPQSIKVNSFSDYQEKLRQAFVMVDQAERQQEILKQIQMLCKTQGLIYQEDLGLLEEVTGLVEWPVAYLGRIDDRFMSLPPELLSMTMRVHQRYFTVHHPDGTLAPFFIVIANLPGSDHGESIIVGNERVLRARFEDAHFYYNLDLKHSLVEHGQKLSMYVFHAQLGSMTEKAERLIALSQVLTEDPKEKEQLAEAAKLCKADLVTDLVREFPELQGVIGSYYAQTSGYSSNVAQAIYEHYAPKGSSDSIPESRLGQLLSLADRLDSLVGFFSVGIKPTGSKDPYALRRAALGVIRILEHDGFKMTVKDLLKMVYEQYGGIFQNKQVSSFEVLYQDLEAFLIDRLKVYWRDQGLPYDYINAVLAQGLLDPLSLLKSRLLALVEFLKDPSGDGINLLSGYRRATNIVRIESEKEKKSFQESPQAHLFEKAEEGHLFDALKKAESQLERLQQLNQHKQSMVELARLRPLIDQFFDQVMVNVDNPQVRFNRLNLLSYLKRILDQVAHFSEIEGGSANFNS